MHTQDKPTNETQHRYVQPKDVRFLVYYDGPCKTHYVVGDFKSFQEADIDAQIRNIRDGSIVDCGRFRVMTVRWVLNNAD